MRVHIGQFARNTEPFGNLSAGSHARRSAPGGEKPTAPGRPRNFFGEHEAYRPAQAAIVIGQRSWDRRCIFRRRTGQIQTPTDAPTAMISASPSMNGNGSADALLQLAG